MKRSGWIRRLTGLKRKKPLKKKRRQGVTREGHWRRVFGSPHRVLWVKSQPCVVRGCTDRRIENHHVKTIAAGGTYRDIVPACVFHHREFHDAGIGAFQERHGLLLRHRAYLTDSAYRRAFPEKSRELEAA